MTGNYAGDGTATRALNTTDGKLVIGKGGTTSANSPSQGNESSENYNADASIDDVRVYSRALTFSEVVSIYADGEVYDFEADTVGVAPANITATNGTITTATGKVAQPTSASSGNTAVFDLDNFPAATDYSVTWKESYTTAGRNGFTLRGTVSNSANSGSTQGYLFQASPSNGSARIYSSNASGYTTLSNITLAAPGVGVDRWYRATVDGSTLTFEYSINGTVFTQIAQITDTTHAGAGVTQLTRGYGSSVSGGSIDDIVMINNDVITNAVAVTNVSEYQVFQRDGSDQADIAISGTYTGTPTAIEASFNGGAYATIDAAPSGGTFSGTLSAQSVGQGGLDVRFTNDTGVTDSTANVGIGDIFIVSGQSNASGRGTTLNSYSHATLKAGLFGNDDNWKELADAVDSNSGQVDSVSSDSASGSPWPLIATQILADQGVPVAFVPTPKGGTRTSQWQPNNSASTLYGSMKRRINAVGGDVAGVLWFQGESDSANGTTAATHQTELEAIVDDINTDFPGLKTMVGQIGHSNYAGNDTIRGAQISTITDNANALPGPATYDINLADESGDTLHFRSNADMAKFADRWYEAIDAEFYGGADGYGPILDAINLTYDSGANKVTVPFDETIVGTSTVTTDSFDLKNNGSSVALTSVAIVGSTVEITPTAPLNTAQTMTLSYASLNDAVDEAIYDAKSLPAQPFYDVTISLPALTNAPGGVSTDIKLWLRGEDVVSGGDNTALTSWPDQSGNGNNGTVDTGTPLYQETTDSINFNPLVEFTNDAVDTTNNTVIGAGGIYTKFVVFKPESLVGPTNLISADAYDSAALFAPAGNLHLWHNGQNITSAATTITTGNPYLVSGRYTAGGIDPNVIRVNGDVDGTSTTVRTFTDAGSIMLGALDTGIATGFFATDTGIAEAIVFSQAMDDTDIHQVESYLALKYGITLDQSASSGGTSYLASDGTTTMWDEDINDNHEFMIFGIGRDDGSALGQVKSKSADSAAIVTVEAEGEGTNTANAFVDIADLEFLTISNNDDGFISGETWYTSFGGTLANFGVLERAWRAQQTGDVGTVQIDIDVADTDFDLEAPLDGGAYYFIQDTDGDTNFDDETPQIMTDQGGDVWRITGVDFTNASEKFTFGSMKAATKIEFEAATASDDENVGGNLPNLLIDGTLATDVNIDVVVSAAGDATIGTDYTFADATSLPQTVTIAIPAGTYTPTTPIALDSLNPPIINQLTENYTTVANPGNHHEETFVAPFTGTYRIALSATSFGSPTDNGWVRVGTTSVSPDGSFDVFEGAADRVETATPSKMYTFSMNAGTTYYIMTGAGGGDSMTDVDMILDYVPQLGFSITGDTDIESDETIDLTLSNAQTGLIITEVSGGTLISNHVYTITNDDNYTVSIAKTTDGAEPGTDASFTVSVSPANTSGSAITGNIAYTGSATNGTDYATGATTFSIANTTSTDVITLNTTDDSDVEGVEAITTTISGLSVGVLGTTAATANLTDDEILSVTVNQDNGQVDPTNIDTAVYTAVFSAAVDPTTFISADISLSGTTGSITTGPTTSDNITWSFTATGMTDADVAVASIAANAVQTLAGGDNTLSTSTDSSVTFDTTNPVPTTPTAPITGTSYMTTDITGSCGIAGNGTAVITTAPANGFSPNYGTTVNLDVSGNYNLTGLTWVDGTYDVVINCTDEAGNGPVPITVTGVEIDNNAPAAPTVLSPTTGEIVDLNPTVTGTCEAGSTVSIASPEITANSTTGACTGGTYAIPVVVTPGSAAVTLTVSQTDPGGNTSTSSNATFETDEDGDGVASSAEDAGFNSGDGDGDGIQDSAQPDVAAAPNPVTGDYTTLKTAGACTFITENAFIAESGLAASDASADYPVGLVDFQVQCTTPGDSADVTIYYAQQYDTSKWKYKKYDGAGNAYADISSLVTFGTATVGTATVTTASFTVTDGDPQTDEDGVVDGFINDPSGPAIVLPRGGSSGSRSNSEEYTCKDSKATNFSNTGIHKESLCEYGEREVVEEKQALLSGGEKCSSSQILTQNMKAGDRNGKASS